MAIVLEKRRPRLLSAEELADEKVEFILPNPGDIFMIVAFAWATLCFVMVTVGPQLARQAAKMVASRDLRELLLTEQTAFAGLMLVGLLGIAGAFYFFNRYKGLTLTLFCIALVNSNANFGPLHFFSFVTKYSIMVYLGAFGAIFFIKNGWRLIGMKGYRLYVMYVGWIGFIAAINQGKFTDLWYLTTEFTLMIGFGIAWLSNIDSREDMLAFNKAICYAAVALTVLNLLSPLVIPNVFVAGRFQSFFNRATGFSTTYAVFVVAMFWMSMYEKRVTLRQIYTVLAFAGFGMIIASGTRNATVATFLGIGALWCEIPTTALLYQGR